MKAGEIFVQLFWSGLWFVLIVLVMYRAIDRTVRSCLEVHEIVSICSAVTEEKGATEICGTLELV